MTAHPNNAKFGNDNGRIQFLTNLRPQIESFFQSRPFNSENPRVPLNASTFGTDEVIEAIDCLLSQNVTMGSKVTEFENQFADYMGSKHAVMVNSGSSANLLILAAVTNPLFKSPQRLHSGDEVIVPAVTWSTTLWPLVQMGCVPVLVDAELETLNMSLEATRAAITSKTKAIFVAHVLGNAADMIGFQKLAKEHGLLLLEDCCESLGSQLGGTPVGKFSAAASFSFFFSHHITTMEGGMIMTDDPELADLLRCLRAHGWTRDMKNRKQIEAQHPEIDSRFLFVNIGYNLRPMEVQAAFGIHQLKKLSQFNTLRRAVARKLCESFEPLKDKLHVVRPTVGAEHTWFGFPVLLTESQAHRRSDFVKHLEDNGIETRPVIAGNLAVQPALNHFAHRKSGHLSNAQKIMDRGVYWGSHPMMSDAEIQHIIKTVIRFFN
jgi:CDP-6-deoxy-D-xylo-4-hexulose-3-dehydrase